MKEYELSKYDFEALDMALEIAMANMISQSNINKLEQLKDKFAKAHSAILFIEEGE